MSISFGPSFAYGIGVPPADILDLSGCHRNASFSYNIESFYKSQREFSSENDPKLKEVDDYQSRSLEDQNRIHRLTGYFEDQEDCIAISKDAYEIARLDNQEANPKFSLHGNRLNQSNRAISKSSSPPPTPSFLKRVDSVLGNSSHESNCSSESTDLECYSPVVPLISNLCEEAPKMDCIKPLPPINNIFSSPVTTNTLHSQWDLKIDKYHFNYITNTENEERKRIELRTKAIEMKLKTYRCNKESCQMSLDELPPPQLTRQHAFIQKEQIIAFCPICHDDDVVDIYY